MYTHTHTHLKCTLKKKEKIFKLYPEGYPVEWWVMYLFFWESPFGTEFFVIHPLTSVVTISWGKLKPLLTLRGVLHIFALFPEPERHGFTPKGGY
jgi:hypothetical protein